MLLVNLSDRKSTVIVPVSLYSLGTATLWDDPTIKTVSYSKQLHDSMLIYTLQDPGKTSQGVQMKTVVYTNPTDRSYFSQPGSPDLCSISRDMLVSLLSNT